MTLEQAIAHAQEKAKELGKCKCAKEHKQLAKWLIELQEARKLLRRANGGLTITGRD